MQTEHVPAGVRAAAALGAAGAQARHAAAPPAGRRRPALRPAQGRLARQQARRYTPLSNLIFWRTNRKLHSNDYKLG